MTKSLSLNLTKVDSFLEEHEIVYLQPMVTQAHNMLHNKTGQGNDFLGWIDLPINYNKEEFVRIEKAAKK